eukprot:Nitzschia sp. Nitz4//scaffold241_size29735//20649//21683//NITZ4_008029-RA/size29735-processed-gene-0.14-mRNA-1//-1//CDS//3329543784//426//frame0
MRKPANWYFSILVLTAWTVASSLATESVDSLLDDPVEDPFFFVHKSVLIPHDSKISRGGEDAISTSDKFLVVADGVGGWARKNVNPAHYSRMLTATVVELGHENMTRPLPEIVHDANWRTAEEHLGSATCTVLKLVAPDRMETLNVGDSGYSIHRRDPEDPSKLSVHFVSEAGQKMFNFPYQLGGKNGDQVKDVATELKHTLEPNDIIVVFSDGVSDNLVPKQYHSCLNRASDSKDGYKLKSLGLAADCIARAAYSRGKDKKYDSPFAQGARAAGRRKYLGGKHDDIAVVVAQVWTQANETRMEDPYRAVGTVHQLPKWHTLKNKVVTTAAGDEL